MNSIKQSDNLTPNTFELTIQNPNSLEEIVIIPTTSIGDTFALAIALYEFLETHTNNVSQPRPNIYINTNIKKFGVIKHSKGLIWSKCIKGISGKWVPITNTFKLNEITNETWTSFSISTQKAKAILPQWVWKN